MWFSVKFCRAEISFTFGKTRPQLIINSKITRLSLLSSLTRMSVKRLEEEQMILMTHLGKKPTVMNKS